MNLRTRTKKQV